MIVKLVGGGRRKNTYCKSRGRLSFAACSTETLCVNNVWLVLRPSTTYPNGAWWSRFRRPSVRKCGCAMSSSVGVVLSQRATGLPTCCAVVVVVVVVADCRVVDVRGRTIPFSGGCLAWRRLSPPVACAIGALATVHRGGAALAAVQVPHDNRHVICMHLLLVDESCLASSTRKPKQDKRPRGGHDSHLISLTRGPFGCIARQMRIIRVLILA